MADQENFPDIYVDGSTGGDGSLASPYADFGEINWSTGGDNSIYDHYNDTPTASVTINLLEGETWREKLSIGTNGVAAYPLTVRTYGDGDKPLIKGSDAVSGWEPEGTQYVWEATLNTETDLVFFDDTMGTRVDALVDVDSDQKWFWESNVLYQYSTTDPDDRYTSPGTEAAVRGCILVSFRSYVTIDGLELRHGNGADYSGGLRSDGCQYLVVQNCEANWNNGQGISIKGNYCTIDNCLASYNGSHGLSAGGSLGQHATYMTIKNSVSHHTRAELWIGEAPWDGYGIKFLYVDDSEIFRNESYSNALPGINLDGGNTEGCYDCKVYENECYDNEYQGILLEIYSSRNRVYLNKIHDNGSGGSSQAHEVSISHGSEDNEIYNNVIYRTQDFGNNGYLIYIGTYDPDGPCSGTKIYGNTMVGGGISKRGILIDGYTAPEDTKIYNNVIVGTVQDPINIAGSSLTGLFIDYNCLRRETHTEGATDVANIQYGGYTISELAAETYGGDNNTDSAPSFTDADNDDFTLAPGSSCINTGTTLNAPYNIALLRDSVWPDGVITGDQEDY